MPLAIASVHLVTLLLTTAGCLADDAAVPPSFDSDDTNGAALTPAPISDEHRKLLHLLLAVDHVNDSPEQHYPGPEAPPCADPLCAVPRPRTAGPYAPSASDDARTETESNRKLQVKGLNPDYDLPGPGHRNSSSAAANDTDEKPRTYQFPCPPGMTGVDCSYPTDRDDGNRTGADAIDYTPFFPNGTDFSRCGVFPACRAGVDGTGRARVTCDRALTSVVIAVVCALIATIGATNLLVVIVFARTRALRKPHAYFKLSLAFSALVYAGVYMPSIVINMMSSIFYDERDLVQLMTIGKGRMSRVLAAEFGAVADGIDSASLDVDPNVSVAFAVVGVFSSIVTVFSVKHLLARSLMLLSVDSYVAVKWPMKYRVGDVMTRKRALLAVACVWVFAFVAAALPVIAKQVSTAALLYPTFMHVPLLKSLEADGNSTQTTSFVESYWPALTYAVLVWGVPFVATWTLTIMMAVRCRLMLGHMRDARKNSSRHGSSTHSMSRVDRSLHVTHVVVLTVFTVTVLPVFAALVAVAVYPLVAACMPAPAAMALFVAHHLFAAGSLLNCAVYTLFHKEFRDAARKLAFDACCCLRVDSRLPSKRRRRGAKASTSSWRARSSTTSSSASTKSALRTLSASLSLSTSASIGRLSRAMSGNRRSTAPPK